MSPDTSDIHALPDSPAQARWVYEHHIGTQTERSRCPICETWWPCDLAGLAALAVQATDELERLRTAAICGESGDTFQCVFCLAWDADRDAIDHQDDCELMRGEEERC